MDMSTRPRTARSPAKPKVKPVSLALQGGGAHGAFTWGVLDRIVEDGRLGIEGISATSAGAMNAAVLASGWSHGGAEGARDAMTAFWKAVSDAGARYNPMQSWPWSTVFGALSMEQTPGYFLMDVATRVFSPYQLNPLNINPLREVLEAHVDFAGLRRHSAIKLFLAATNVETCKMRIFQSSDVTAEAVLASACLPFLFQAVEIEGQFYWDGGYLGNPAIFPLIYHCDTADVVIVHVNPILRPGCPRTAGEILNRLNEVSFNSSLMREMRAIAYVTSLIESGKLEPHEAKRIHVHAIRADETMAQHGASSKFNLEWGFLCQLRDEGRAHAERWLEAHYAQVGKESSVEVGAEFL